MQSKFSSLTVEFEDAQFQSDLKELEIRARYIDESNQGFPEYEYTGSKASLRVLINTWFGGEEGLLDTMELNSLPKR